MLEFLPRALRGRRSRTEGLPRRPASRRRSRTSRLGLESLEGRLCLSAFAIDDSLSVIQGGSSVVNVLDNDYSDTGTIDSATVQIVSMPEHGNLIDYGDGDFGYFPDSGFLGSDSFQYQVKDTAGELSNVGTVFISVDPNQSPVAGDDAYTVAGDGPSVLPVYYNDYDPEGQPDYSSYAVDTQPAHGTVQVQFGYQFLYTPEPGYRGPDSFTYTFKDALGLVSNAAAVSLNVVDNTPPVAEDDVFTVYEGSSANYLYPDANDYDPEGQLDSGSFEIASGPAHGTVVIEFGHDFYYTPEPGYVGMDSFTYTVKDNQGLVSNTATVTLDVIVNTPPVAADDALVTPVGVGISLAELLTNDADPEGESLWPGNIAVASSPGHGTIAYNSTVGWLVYTPDPGYSGSDSFSYTIADSSGKISNVAWVNVSVQGSNPTLTSPTAGGLLPAGVTPVGGVVLDMIGVNGARVVSQLPASQLYIGYFDSGTPTAYQGNPGTIGIQYGITPEILAALGGGLSELAVRITVYDGDTGEGDFDDQGQNFLLLNGVRIGDFSDVPAVSTTGDGAVIISYSRGGGFRDGTLDTGFFYTNDPTLLEHFYSTLSGGQVSYKLEDVDPYDNYFDFTQGVDGGLIDVGTAPNTRPTAQDDAATTPLNTAIVIHPAANDVDSDGSVVASTLVITQAPLHGTVAVDPATGAVTYTPAMNYSGSDSFRYTIRDDDGAISNQGTVTVNVLPLPSVLDVSVRYGSRSYSLLSNTRILPFVNLTKISFAFAENVNLSIGDLSLTGINVPSYGIVGYSYDAASRVATWTLAQAIGADRLTLSILGDEVLRFNVLPGDYNQDGVVTIDDARAVLMNPGDLFADLDGDGDVDIDDVNAVRKRIKSRLP